MCGIIGIISKQPFSIKNDLLNSLKRLEYRGYDSVGFATPAHFRKGTDSISEFMEKLKDEKAEIGIAHTRWATHGNVSERNAHPHSNETLTLFAVHNGIIENYQELRSSLTKKGHIFSSDTDSEVIVHYFEEKLKNKDFKNAIIDFFKDIKGTFAVLMFDKKEKKLYAIKKDSPLALGLCKDHFVLASDIYAFSGKTNKAIFFEDNEFAILTDSGYSFFNSKGNKISKQAKTFEWEWEKELEKKYRHYMIKEIHEQPAAAGRLLNSLKTSQKKQAEQIASLIKQSKRVVFLACGTSYHAALVGEAVFNRLGIEAFATNAADFNSYLIKDNTLIIAITQSGETMDVIKPIKEINKKNVKIVSFVNVPYSTIQRLSEYSIEISAGQEICVAATKTFTNQVLTILYLAKALGYKTDLDKIPKKIEKTITGNENKLKNLANELYNKKDIYVLGKGILFPIAKEIALKVKEISYIHAEGMQAGELKHGTIAMIEKGTPVISLIPDNNSHLVSNTKEVESRGAFTITITNTKTDIKADADFAVPQGDEAEFAIFSNVIGQLLTYYVALKLGRPVDKPRNLAKTICVL